MSARRRASGSPQDGADELARWLRTPPDLASPPRDELVMKVLVALRVPGTDVREVIQVHRRYLVQLMQQWTRIKEEEAEYDLGLALVVDAELFRLDAVIRWLDAADGRLKRAGAEPAPTEPAPACAATAAPPGGAAAMSSRRPQTRRREDGDDEHAGTAGRVQDVRRRAQARCTRCAVSACR